MIKNLNIILLGSQGRMGQAIKQVFTTMKNLNIIEIDIKNNIGYQNLAEIKEEFCAIIDFTVPKFSLEALFFAKKHKAAFISGTTGFTSDELHLMKDIAKDIPVFYAPNFSLGIHLLKQALNLLIPQTVEDYDIEIIETHHNQKKDAPSGTALSIKDTILKAGNIDEDKVIYGRQGIVGERPLKEVAIHTVRGGDVFGNHSILLAGKGEVLELSHRATSRDVFASGVLKATKFILNKKCGLYGMNDLL